MFKSLGIIHLGFRRTTFFLDKLTWRNASLIRAFRQFHHKTSFCYQLSVAEVLGWPIWLLESQLGHMVPNSFGLSSVLHQVCADQPSILLFWSRFPWQVSEKNKTNLNSWLKRFIWHSLKSVFLQGTSWMCLWRWTSRCALFVNVQVSGQKNVLKKSFKTGHNRNKKAIWLKEEVVKGLDDPWKSKAIACGSRTLGRPRLFSP